MTLGSVLNNLYFYNAGYRGTEHFLGIALKVMIVYNQLTGLLPCLLACLLVVAYSSLSVDGDVFSL